MKVHLWQTLAIYASLDVGTKQPLMIPAGYIVIVFIEHDASVTVQWSFLGSKRG